MAFWLSLVAGLSGGILLGAGHFAAAAAMVAIVVLGTRIPSREPFLSLRLGLAELLLLGGTVFYYRQSVMLQCLALFVLLGAFVSGQWPISITRVRERILVLGTASLLSVFNANLLIGGMVVLGLLTHSASIAMVARQLKRRLRAQGVGQNLVIPFAGYLDGTQ